MLEIRTGVICRRGGIWYTGMGVDEYNESQNRAKAKEAIDNPKLMFIQDDRRGHVDIARRYFCCSAVQEQA